MLLRASFETLLLSFEARGNPWRLLVGHRGALADMAPGEDREASVALRELRDHGFYVARDAVYPKLCDEAVE